MKACYYNENDRYAARWLRNLIVAGLIAPGDVDERSVADVSPDDVRGYSQCHFFAGIGGWSYALRLAGWDDDRPVWTGSCPCQPFSAAGKQSGAADDRHLWPQWLRLIRECRPDTILGEQVEGAVRFGWIDRVFADLEAEDYTCGAAVLGAHSVGAPHIRQRLFWVADASVQGSRSRAGGQQVGQHGRSVIAASDVFWMADAAGGQSHRSEREPEIFAEPANGGDAGGDAGGEGLSPSELALLPGSNRHDEGRATGEPSRSFWTEAQWLPCADGKARRVEPSIFPLADAGEWGTGSRLGILRGAGNAIVPAVAAEFVRTFMDW